MEYFKTYAESLDGQTGYMYMEVDSSNRITRQLYVFGDMMFWAEPDAESDPRYMFTDQPEINAKEDDLEPVASGEFESLWNESRSHAGDLCDR